MANDNPNAIPADQNTIAPVKNGGTADGFWFVTVPAGKEIVVTDDGTGGEHPFEQPADSNSWGADGKPQTGKSKYKVDKDGNETGYNPAAAWVQSAGGKAEVVITPGRAVLVNIKAQRIAHKLQMGELVRCDKDCNIQS